MTRHLKSFVLILAALVLQGLARAEVKPFARGLGALSCQQMAETYPQASNAPPVSRDLLDYTLSTYITGYLTGENSVVALNADPASEFATDGGDIAGKEPIRNLVDMTKEECRANPSMPVITAIKTIEIQLDRKKHHPE
jgi:hypothetical protein